MPWFGGFDFAALFSNLTGGYNIKQYHSVAYHGGVLVRAGGAHLCISVVNPQPGGEGQIIPSTLLQAPPDFRSSYGPGWCACGALMQA